jgi:hypothetical protein
VTQTPWGNPQAVQSLKTALSTKANPSWGAAQGSATKVVSQVKPNAAPKIPAIRLTYAAQKHYKQVKKANSGNSSSTIDTALPATDDGLIALVAKHYFDFTPVDDTWTFELGDFETVAPHSGDVEPVRWTIVGKTDTNDGAFVVMHYGPYGVAKAW